MSAPNFLEPETKWWNEEPPAEKPKTGRVIIFIAAAFLFLGGVTYAGNVLMGQATRDVNNTFGPPKTFLGKVRVLLTSGDRKLKGEIDDRINILLLGMGGAGHEGPYLTDTIIIASIKPSTRQMAMMSIPRDFVVNLPDYGGWRKINNVNAFAEMETAGSGAEKTRAIVENVFGQPIQYYVRVDFKGFEKIIDLVGGVKVDVERSFTDNQFPYGEPGVRYSGDRSLRDQSPLNQTPNQSPSSTAPIYRVVSFTKGWQEMDGATALDYVRSRHGTNGEGSDFARGRRQQKLLAALKEKILSVGTLLNPLKVKGLLDTLDKNVVTNLNTADLLRFSNFANDFNGADVKHLVLDDSDKGFLKAGMYDGAFVLEPKSGNMEEIKQALVGIFANQTLAVSFGKQSTATSTAVNIEIQNGTWRSGLAATAKKEVEDLSFSVFKIGNSLQRPLAATIIYDKSNGQFPDVTKKLGTQLRAAVTTIAPPWFAAATSSAATIDDKTDILVLIGNDYLSYVTTARNAL